MQKTFSEIFEIQGIGLHSGLPSKMTFYPADANSGIVFVRADLPNKPEFKAVYNQVVDTRNCTCLGNEKKEIVSTIEHIMAALYVLGVDNARIEVTNPETPIMDGSAKVLKIAPARTFCEKYQVDYLRSIGLIKGGSLENAVVLDGEKILNEGGFRVENEAVNHKVLDCIGDMYTSGYRLLANITAEKSGHFHNNEVLKKLFADTHNYQIIEE